MIIKHSKKSILIFYTITSLVYGFNAVFIAFIIKELIDMVTNNNMSNIYTLIIIGIIGFIFFFIIGIQMEMYKNKIIESININLKNIVVSNYFNSSMEEQEDLNVSGYIQSDMKLLENNGIHAELQMISLFFTFVFSLGASLYLDVWTTISFFIGMFLSAILTMLGQGKINDLTDKWSGDIDELVSDIEENNKNKESYIYVNAFGNIKQRITSKILNVESSLYKLNFTIDRKNQVIYITTMLLSIFIPFIVGGFRISEGFLTLAAFIAIVQLSNSIINPILQGIQLTNERQVVSSITKKFDTYNNLIPQKHSNLDNFQELIYSDNFKGNKIDIDLERGDRYLIKGPSGIGKSTILNNFICPNKFDQYKIDGIEVSKFNCYSSLFSYVPQKPQIYADTLLFNLTLGRKISEEKIKDILGIVGLEDFYRERGLKYKIEKNSKNISGGEAQRITIARALLDDTDILLLDEITAFLDETTAHEIRKNITAMNKTIIEVAHHIDEEYSKSFNKTLLLEGGKQ